MLVEQIYWFETILKFSAGLMLLLFPLSAARVLGLPHGNVGFWARIVGVTLLGMSAAIYIEAAKLSTTGGLGLAGLAAINVSSVFIFLSMAIMRQITTVRGSFAVWSVIVALSLLTMFELAYA
ncbi:MAG: hypothetical protein ACR2PG_01200 [Hyphomicrobiaceae bacterium]